MRFQNALSRSERRQWFYSLRLPLLFGSELGVALGSAALVADASEDLDSDELRSDLLSDFDSDGLDSEDFDSDVVFDSDLLSDFESELESDLDSDAFFESDAADFLYDSLR